MAELAEHNNREWFSANKTRYEDLVKDPALRFIAAFAAELKGISPHFMATPYSGSIGMHASLETRALIRPGQESSSGTIRQRMSMLLDIICT